MKRILRFLLFLLNILLAHQTIAQHIGAGDSQSIALCEDGQPKTWGLNNFGQLGDSTNINSSLPVSVNNLTEVKAVTSGWGHCVAIKNDGTVWQWGSYSNHPVQVPTLTNITQVVTGGFNAGFHNLALRADGTVWGWGYNVTGQLGDSTTTDRTTPVMVHNLTGAVAIAVGVNFSLALKNDGTVWGWGNNYNGQLGDTSFVTHLVPVQVNGLANITAIAAGYWHGLAVRNDGTVWAWGQNYNGQLGDGTRDTLATGCNCKTTPVQASFITGVQKVSAGYCHSMALKNDGTVWGWGFNDNGQIGNETYYIYITTPVQTHVINGIIEISAGEYHTLALRNDGTLWAWGKNYNGQLGTGNTNWSWKPVQTHNLCFVGTTNHHVRGLLYNDTSADCSIQPNELRLGFIPAVATPGSIYGFSNDTGYYSIGVGDSTNYSIKPVVPQNIAYMLSNPCPDSSSVYLTAASANDTSGFNFGFEGTPCYQLRVDITANRKRRCFVNTVVVRYWNEGLISADSVKVHVKFEQYDIPVGASLPYTIDAFDSSLVFNIGTLLPWQSGSINVYDSIACLPAILNLTKCTKAWILPANDCLIDSTTGPGWDHSSMSVDGACVNDTCRFVIYNNGTGDMAVPQQYRIYANNILVYTGSYQLLSGDSLVVLWVSGGATIRLEADQHPDHPGHSHPRYTLEACGTDSFGNYSTGEVNRAPMDDEDVDVEIDCMQIHDSYDPNEKDNAPEGVTNAHTVLPNTPIDFTIHFQNTGTDTAYRVVVIDSLSNDLDLATLELGASSHPYTVSLSGQGAAVLKFTFSNINLSDSTTDELNSHGFVKYKISPKSATPLGTRINNSADIYFDYNFPVRTNTAYVTLGNELVLGITQSALARSGSVVAYPNPTKGFITVESGKNHSIQQLTLYSADGRILKSIVNCQLST